MFDLILARGWHATTSAIHSLSSTRPRRWRRWKWSYTPPSPSPSASSPLLLSFYASLDGNAGGVTPKARAERCDRVRTFSRPPTAGWLSAICELMCNVHIARMGWAPNPINYILIALLCIGTPISCNICIFVNFQFVNSMLFKTITRLNAKSTI